MLQDAGIYALDQAQLELSEILTENGKEIIQDYYSGLNKLMDGSDKDKDELLSDNQLDLALDDISNMSDTQLLVTKMNHENKDQSELDTSSSPHLLKA